MVLAEKQRSGPDANRTASKPNFTYDDCATDRRPFRRKAWAFPYINRADGLIPLYGSDEWLALPEDDPTRVASCVRAAEAWASAGDDLVSGLRQEVEELRYAHKQNEDAAYVARRDAHRAEWRHLSLVRTFPWNERNNGSPDGVA